MLPLINIETIPTDIKCDCRHYLCNSVYEKVKEFNVKQDITLVAYSTTEENGKITIVKQKRLYLLMGKTRCIIQFMNYIWNNTHTNEPAYEHYVLQPLYKTISYTNPKNITYIPIYMKDNIVLILKDDAVVKYIIDITEHEKYDYDSALKSTDECIRELVKPWSAKSDKMLYFTGFKKPPNSLVDKIPELREKP